MTVIQNNDDTQQAIYQKVVFPFRQNEPVESEGDEAAGECAPNRARFRQVGQVSTGAIPNRQAHYSGEKYKPRNACLNQKRDDVAVDRRTDIETTGHEPVPSDRI